MDIYTLLIITHLFGVALGVGGAFVSDLMFFKSVRDQKISGTEIEFLKLGSIAVWAGLALLVVSGTGLFLLDTEQYIASSKFLAKMTIVAVIIINGIVFHTIHIPRIMRHMDHHFPSSDEFMRKRSFLIMSGAVSATSWPCALILGALRDVSYSYTTIMIIYITLLLTATVSALILKDYIVPTNR